MKNRSPSDQYRYDKLPQTHSDNPYLGSITSNGHGKLTRGTSSKRSQGSSYGQAALQKDFDRGVRRNEALLREQDEGLDQLVLSVDRIGVLSREIGREVQDHNRMLGELQDDIEESSETMARLTEMTEELIEQSGGCRNFTIIVTLSAIALVLFLLILYT